MLANRRNGGNVMYLRLYCVLCDQLVYMDGFLLADSIDSVDSLAFDTLLPPSEVNISCWVYVSHGNAGAHGSILQENLVTSRQIVT